MTRPLFDRPAVIAALILVQSLSAVYFLWDVVGDGLGSLALTWSDRHLLLEVVAVVALIAGIAFEVRVLFGLLRRKAHLERQASLAASALHDVIDAHFDSWGLTAAERDVAHFTVKGLGIADIANLRGSAEGTVKSQLNAIYRKANVSNRGELLSLLIEDLASLRDIR